MPSGYDTSPEDKAEAKRLSAAGATPAEISRKVGLPDSTIRRILKAGVEKKEQVQKLAVGPTPFELQEMSRAALNNDEETPAEKWGRAERDGSRRIRKAQEASKAAWRASGKHVLISFLSDQHIAPGTPIDFKAMREDAELITRTPHAYAMLGGDGVDNHLKHRAAILAARSQPSDQYELFEHYMRIFNDRLLAMVSGNHDNWSTQFAGIDMLARIAKDNRVFYNPDEMYLDLEVGSQKYVIGLRHQYRFNSSFNQTHSVKQWFRNGVREFDVGVVCHHHEAAIEQFMARGRHCWACRPGSYQITSAYSRQYGFNQAVPTSPTFLFRGDTHEVYGWNSVRSALDCLRVMREVGL